MSSENRKGGSGLEYDHAAAVQRLAAARTRLAERPPHVHALPADFHHHLIEMPDAVSSRALAANVGGDGGTRLHRPTPYGLVADVDATLGEQFIDITQTQREGIK